MANTPNFQLTIDFRDSYLDDQKQLEPFTQRLCTQMGDNLKEVEASRIPVSKSPAGHMGENEESGILSVELNPGKIKALMTFLWERLSGKATEFEVTVGKISIKLKVGSQKDLPAAIQEVEKLVKSISEINND